MFTGSIIDELIHEVEKAEVAARTHVLAPMVMMAHDTRPMPSSYVYEMAMLHQAVVGVA